MILSTPGHASELSLVSLPLAAGTTLGIPALGAAEGQAATGPGPRTPES